MDWFFVYLADNIIVHTRIGKEYLKDNYRREKNVFIISHGNYIDVYGKIIKERLKVREKLGHKENDLIFLNLGMLRPYKGLEELIIVFNQFSSYNNLKLLIIGKGNNVYIEELKKIVRNKNIIIENRFIPDTEIPIYFALADFSIFAYKKILTSGAAVLSLSYAVSVIAPRGGDLPELIENGQNGFLFSKKNELEKIITAVSKFNLEQKEIMRRRALSSARKLDWRNIANEIIEIYNSN